MFKVTFLKVSSNVMELRESERDRERQREREKEKEREREIIKAECELCSYSLEICKLLSHDKKEANCKLLFLSISSLNSSYLRVFCRKNEIGSSGGKSSNRGL